MNAPFLRDSTGRLVTDRLRLRQWTDADRAPFRALHRDPRVMAHFPTLLFDAECDQVLDAIHVRLASEGIGLWAVERLADGRFIGFAGAEPIELDGALALNCSLDPRWWRQGYASEALRAALWVAFEERGATRVLAAIPPRNENAAALARRIGLTRRPDLDFDHPARSPEHPLCATIVYAIDREDTRA